MWSFVCSHLYTNVLVCHNGVSDLPTFTHLIGKGQLGGNTSVHVLTPPVIAKVGVKFGRG